ncbi:uncharacterized protein [Nothobranchius furzeri]|uniref:uncharacterized protein isoform X2 n=1 Tax=Nothobranchius furzeri TaxID=105023 RepID=UPI0039046C26
MRKENMEDIRPTEPSCQVNRKHAPPAVPLRKKNSPLFKAEARKSEPVAKKEIQTYLQSEKMNKEGIDHVKPLETNSEKSAAAEEDLAPLPGPITATMKVKDLARMFSVMMDEEKAAWPKETFREKLKHSQSATDAWRNPKASAAAEEVQQETPSSLFGAAKSGFITGMKVKELAQMFSEKEAAAKEKDPEHELNQVDEVQTEGILLTTPQTAVQPMEEEQKPTQALSDSTSVITRSDPAAKPDKKHKPVRKAVQTYGHSSGSKVNRKHAPPAVPLRKKNSPLFKAEAKKSEPVAKKEIQTYLQSEKMNKEGIDHVKPLETNSEKSAAAEEDLAPLPGPITATMKVKDLARMFSVMMDEEQAAWPKETFRTKLKHSQVKDLAQMFSDMAPQDKAI